MSKKDRQHQHLQQPIAPHLANQPHPPIPDGATASVDEMPALRASLREFQELSAARAAEVLDLKRDIDNLAKAARHGAPPEGFEPKTAEGKEALEQVVMLGNIAKEQRARAEDEFRHADDAKRELEKMFQEKSRIETDVTGIIEERDRLRVRVSTLEASAAAPATPSTGWASDTARQLVEAVPPHERVLLLGDLLAQLLPHTGEQGQNETASDVLKRILARNEELRAGGDHMTKEYEALIKQRDAMSDRMAQVQAAMVARRAPDAEVGVLLEDFVRLMGPVADAMGHDRKHLRTAGLPILLSLVKEWKGLRGFFSAAPLTAVAVRDDGHNGPVRERYSLLVLKWDGKAVQTLVAENTVPWGDISRYLEQTARKHLIPEAYR